VHARALARVAGKFQDDLLRGLCFFVKHWFGLTPVTRLFSVVTAFTLRVQRRLPGFVLRHFLDRVLLASLAIRSSSFWNLCMMFGRDRVGLVSGNFSLNYH